MLEIEQKSEAQKGAERSVGEFHQSLGPFVVAAEHTRMAMVFTRNAPDNPIIFANDAFLRLTHYSREEVLGASLSDLMDAGTDRATYDKVSEAFESLEPRNGMELEYCRKDGTTFCAALQVSPVRDESGEIIQHVASLIDLTEHKAEQEHAKMMIDELNHRVKNTLATVQAIVSQALRNAASAPDIRKSIEERLFALSRSHELLTDERWKGVGMCEVVETAMQPFHDGSRRFDIKGKNLRLPPKVTLALGIAFHELATNALKYGAFSNETGTVDIGWEVNERRLLISWREKGGPPVAKPSSTGFGSQVLTRGLAHELDGKVELTFDPEGASCLIDIPLPPQ